MSPDPVTDGQPIKRWLVRLRADGSGECRTVIRVREDAGDEVIAKETVYRLRPGINEIAVEPEERYRFSRKEHRFVVLADIGGTPRRVDAERRFCADQRNDRRWSMR